MRLLTTELALRCYRSKQGRSPERLEQLVPTQLPRVPVDPFSSRPLIYRPQGTNWQLYSIGPDRVDDGGTPVSRFVPGSVGINKIELETEGVVPGIDDQAFQAAAAKAKEVCPVSKALAAVKDITVSAKLVRA